MVLAHVTMGFSHLQKEFVLIMSIIDIILMAALSAQMYRTKLHLPLLRAAVLLSPKYQRVLGVTQQMLKVLSAKQTPAIVQMALLL